MGDISFGGCCAAYVAAELIGPILVSARAFSARLTCLAGIPCEFLILRPLKSLRLKCFVRISSSRASPFGRLDDATLHGISDSDLVGRLSKLISQTTTDAFIAIDPDNRVIFWNHGAEGLLGWRSSEIVGQSLDIIIPASKHLHHGAAVKRLCEGHQSRLEGKMTEVVALHKDGREVFADLTLSILRNQQTGHPMAFAAILRDATERRVLEKERDKYASELEEHLAAVQATSDGIAITDSNGFFTFMNPAHAQMFGYSDPNELIGQHWSKLYPTDETERIERVAVPSTFALGTWRGEARGLNRLGQIIEQEVVLAASPNGGLICTTRDIGERRNILREQIRNREQLLVIERQEQIGRAMSGLVHDFANLITVIAASAATLRSNTIDPNPEVDRILEVTRQATTLIERIIAPKNLSEHPYRLDAEIALKKVLDLTAVSLTAPHSIRLNVVDAGIVLKAEETEFLRVMLNLCTNARDSLPPNSAGLIDISVAMYDTKTTIPNPSVGVIPSGPAALLSVTDNGCGISASDMEVIFQPFRTMKPFGVGLGLANVAAIVTNIGGSISVKSGVAGTTFYLVWPLASEGQIYDAVAFDGPSEMLSGAQIVVIDDNPDILELIAADLREAGAEVAAYTDPAEALLLLQDEPSLWHAVVVDYDMPGMNGAEFAKAVHESWPHLPVILCSALLRPSCMEHRSLFAAEISKTSSIHELPQIIFSLFSQPREDIN